MYALYVLYLCLASHRFISCQNFPNKSKRLFVTICTIVCENFQLQNNVDNWFILLNINFAI